MDFGEALRALKDGKRVRREGWPQEARYINLQVPDEHSKMTRHYLYSYTLISGEIVPWHPPNADLLAEDWQVV